MAKKQSKRLVKREVIRVEGQVPGIRSMAERHALKSQVERYILGDIVLKKLLFHRLLTKSEFKTLDKQNAQQAGLWEKSILEALRTWNSNSGRWLFSIRRFVILCYRSFGETYNNILSVTEDYIPCVLLGSEYYVDMRELHDALEEADIKHILIDPLAERNMQMPHCFISSERVDKIAKDAFDRMISFIKQPRCTR